MLKIPNGFCDFCIPYNDKKDVMLSIFNEMVEVGYKNVAVEQTYDHKLFSAKDGKDQIPEPVKLDEFRETYRGRLNFFNRLTIIYSDNSVNHLCSKSHNLKKYDILAALPTTESAFQNSCQIFQGDIITYNQDTIKMRFSRKFYYLAIRRNMFFEIKYAPAIVDASERRTTISRAQQYHMVGKSKAILFTSEARDSFQIRSPYDVGCLGFIFGLSEEQGRCSISTTSRQVLVAAQSRRLGKTPVVMKMIESSSTSDSSEEEMEEFCKMEIDGSNNSESASQESNKRKQIATKRNDNNKKMKVL